MPSGRLLTEWQALPPEQGPKLGAEPVVTTLHCTDASPLWLSPAEKVHVCVESGPKIPLFGPLFTVSVGGVLSTITVRDASAVRPVRSVATALNCREPSCPTVLNETPYGAVVSVPSEVAPTKNCTLDTWLLSLAVACTLIVPVTLDPLGEVRLTDGAWTSLKVALTDLSSSIVTVHVPVPEQAPPQPSHDQPECVAAVSVTSW